MYCYVGTKTSKLLINFDLCFSSNTYSYLFAPVHTIFPELNIKAVVRGSLILIITAAKRC